MVKQTIYIILLILLTGCSSCSKEKLDNAVIWTNRICGDILIYDDGLGYPIYKNTVVFHSTPEPWGDKRETVLHGLDVNTGKEKWKLSNEDFYPKESFRLLTIGYYYQNEKIVVGADFCSNYLYKKEERYIYGIDIEKGKVLWVKELPDETNESGLWVIGRGEYAYVDVMSKDGSFSLYKIDIRTGNYHEEMRFTEQNLPTNIPIRKFSISKSTQVYTNPAGEEFIALSFSSYDDTIDRYHAHMTLCVYNLSTSTIAYTYYINENTLQEGVYDAFSAKTVFHNGKIFIGKDKNFYCVDAFEDKGILWTYNTGPYGTDGIMLAIAHDDIAIGYTQTDLMAFNIHTGEKLYTTPCRSSSTPNIIDGIIYQRDGSDLLMRDPYTGKALKRVATPVNSQAFAGSRPNGADGKIFIHSFTDAYCIKAWGE